jgi:serine/threonine protein phosphatase PrpC
VREVALAWGAATDTGSRSENQDSLLARPPVFAVADGMGGHAAGRQASVVAVDRLATTVDGLPGGAPLTVETLRDALRAADTDIRRVAETLGDARGMGTTMAGIALVMPSTAEERPCWAVFHIGDSRVYRLTGAGLAQLSTDHSVVQELVDMGMITAAAAAVHPQRHLVTRALGVGPAAHADVALLPVEPGQRFLVCSDGLTGELHDEEIAGLLAGAPDAEAAARDLVRTAAERGASDNVTAVVVEVRDVPPDGDRAAGPGAAPASAGG